MILVRVVDQVLFAFVSDTWQSGLCLRAELVNLFGILQHRNTGLIPSP